MTNLIIVTTIQDKIQGQDIHSNNIETYKSNGN
jgi:hypothetical protein